MHGDRAAAARSGRGVREVRHAVAAHTPCVRDELGHPRPRDDEPAVPGPFEPPQPATSTVSPSNPVIAAVRLIGSDRRRRGPQGTCSAWRVWLDALVIALLLPWGAWTGVVVLAQDSRRASASSRARALGRVAGFRHNSCVNELAAPLRVVVADDSVLLREGVARLLEDAGFAVVGRSGNATDLMLKVRSYSPDVAIVDIKMPPTYKDEGVQAAKEIREKYPETAVLVLSQYAEPGYALELLQHSAERVGYLLKDRINDVPEFTAAVQRVAAGGSALDSSVVSQLVGRRRRDDPLAELTPREREVLQLMAEGLSNVAIAERIVVTERAVEKHVTSIFQKLGLPPAPDTHRRVLAVLAYLHS